MTFFGSVPGLAGVEFARHVQEMIRMSDVLAVTNQNFDQEVLKSDIPVLVDFWAPWCGPCRMIAPHVDAIAAELGGKLKVVKLNTDDASEIATRYGIMSIPTLMVFKGGQVVEQMVGAQQKANIVAKITPHLG
jgi:thioredoxin